jgi:hypothetical protein
MARREGPVKTHRYTIEFKLKAVKLPRSAPLRSPLRFKTLAHPNSNRSEDQHN